MEGKLGKSECVAVDLLLAGLREHLLVFMELVLW